MREELKALGLEAETVEAIMRIHGKHNAELEKAVKSAKLEGEEAIKKLRSYEKGGESYIDPAEHERLKAFENDTLRKAVVEKKKAALIKLYKNGGAKEGAIKLLLKGQNWDEIEVDDKEDVKNGAEILKAAQAEYADGFGVNGNTGAPHVPDEEGGSSKTNNRQKYY